MAIARHLAFEKEKNLKAGAYTLLIAAAIVALLLFIRWQIPFPPPPLLDQGIEVNLGNSETGFGDVPPMVPGDPAPEAATDNYIPPSANTASQPDETAEESDNTDDIVVPKKAEKPPSKTRPVENPTTKSTTQTQLPPAPAQPKPKATMGTYTGGKGTGGNNQDAFNNVRNQGVAGGTGDQGKSKGNINSDSYTGSGGSGKSGVSISRGLGGRNILRTPSFEDDFNENAKIAVDIRVDAGGNVISAAYQSRSSTSSKANLKAIALRKVKEVKFSSGEGESLGTVIFNFRLKE